jgi:pyridoxine 5-phosphate synthase
MIEKRDRKRTLRLGINIDHVATIRNARGGVHPDPVRAALQAMAAGADGITAHLREDRRHIRDHDMKRLREEVALPLNFEMAATDEMMQIALAIAPHAVCLVPEKRTEVTTEGGLDVAGKILSLGPYIARLNAAKIRVSLFIDADDHQVRAAKQVQAPVIELHTGRYCEAHGTEQNAELTRLQMAAKLADDLGIECHAGHGLDYRTVKAVAAIATIQELNIGHFLIGEAVFAGLSESIHKMRNLMDEARFA